MVKSSTSMIIRSSSTFLKPSSYSTKSLLFLDIIFIAIDDLHKSQELLMNSNVDLGNELKSRLDILTF